MEQRKNDIFLPLLFNNLKSKKNWFFLSTVILFVTTMLIPFILGIDKEVFIAFGMFELFVLVFINCLVDNSFLHNDSKLAYYKSKPVSFKEQISINILVNIIFAAFLILLIILSIAIQKLDYDIIEAFKIIVPWLLAGIFLTSLSSILSGNTLVAAIMTIFNFALPGIIYLIIQFMFSILENIVPGFSARVLMDYFVNTIYKLEYIYFFVYSEKPIDFVYLLILAIILIAISLLILKMLKRRKNENTGSLIVFDGYKYFVSVLACLIIPATFSVISNGRNIINEIFVSLLMATLTYYIIIAVMEKSFRISRLSLKVFIASITVFIALTGGTVAVANQYKDSIPDLEDVKMAYIGNDAWIYNRINSYMETKGLSEQSVNEVQEIYNIVLFTDKENIKTITELHKELISNQDYNSDGYYLSNVVIVYYMNDGSYIIRSYKVDNSYGETDKKDELTTRLLSSEEFKKTKYFYLYNDKYYQNDDYTININLINNSDAKHNKIKIEDIRPHLIKDIQNEQVVKKGSFLALSSYNFEMPYYDYKETTGYYLEITIIDNKIKYQENDARKENYYTIQLDDRFKNTKEYLNL